jgi:hypothetical protein
MSEAYPTKRSMIKAYAIAGILCPDLLLEPWNVTIGFTTRDYHTLWSGGWRPAQDDGSGRAAAASIRL